MIGEPGGRKPHAFAPYMIDGVTTAFKISSRVYRFGLAQGVEKTLRFKFFPRIFRFLDWPVKKGQPFFCVKCIPGSTPDVESWRIKYETSYRVCFSAYNYKTTFPTQQ